MNPLKIFTVLFLVISIKLKAQEYKFVLPQNSAMQFNPALIGGDTLSQAGLAYKTESVGWYKGTGINGYFNTYLTKTNGYLGVSFLSGVTDYSSPSFPTIKTRLFSLYYGQDLKLSESALIRIGVQLSRYHRFLSSQIQYGDMIDPERGFIFSSLDRLKPNGAVGFNYNSGISLYLKRFIFSAAVYNLNRPNVSLIEGEYLLDRKLSTSLSYEFQAVMGKNQLLFQPILGFSTEPLNKVAYYQISRIYTAGANIKFSHFILGGQLDRTKSIQTSKKSIWLGYQGRRIGVYGSRSEQTNRYRFDGALQTGVSYEVAMNYKFWPQRSNDRFVKTYGVYF